MPRRIRVAVISGGLSSERGVSLKTGRQVAAALDREKYQVIQIEFKDFAKLITNPKLSKTKIDVAFIALHGKYGEDGRIQAVLDILGIPYTGSGVLASALSMDKAKCSDFVSKHGLKIPKSIIVRPSYNKIDLEKKVRKEIGYPCVVKPNQSGSSFGVSIVKGPRALKEALNSALAEGTVVIIEQYIKGQEFTCGILGNSGSGDILELPPVEIISEGRQFFDFEAKYLSSKTQEICPARISKSLASKIQKQARRAHETLGCDGLTRSDFILSDKDKALYYLETNTIPGQTEASLCPKEAKALGISFPDFISRQIELALDKEKIRN